MAIPSDLDQANFISVATFWFCNRIMAIGQKRPLNFEDLGDVPSLQKIEALIYSMRIKSGEFTVYNFFRYQKLRNALVVIIGLASLGCFTGIPLMIDRVLNFIQDDTGFYSVGYGIGFAFGLFGCQAANAIFYNLGYYLTTLQASDCKSALNYLIYRKALMISPSYAQSAGEIMTYLTVDMERMWDIVMMYYWMFLSPIAVITILAVLSTYVGPAAFIGFAVYIFITSVNFELASWIAVFREEMLAITEQRAGFETEVLQAVRTIKAYGWTEGLTRIRIAPLRRREIVLQGKVLFFTGLTTSVQFLCPILMVGSILILAVSVDSSLEVNVALVYTVLAFVNSLMSCAELMNYVLRYTFDGLVSYRRIKRFLDLPEIVRPLDVTPQERMSGVVAVIEDASLMWTVRSKVPCLSDVNLSFHKGDLIFIIGSTGSGKTCMIQTLLGRTDVRKGTLRASSNLAITSQEAWIRNAPIRTNILFGRPFVQSAYDKCITAAQMRTDLASFPLGDATPIGEKGRTLSGGQQARVALARAFYAALVSPPSSSSECASQVPADLVILDDPLAALDTKTAAGVVNEGLKGLLLGREDPCCVILAINSHYHLLRMATSIILLDEGCVAATGVYDQVKKHPVCVALLNEAKKEEEKRVEFERQSSVLDPACMDSIIPGDLSSHFNANPIGGNTRSPSILSIHKQASELVSRQRSHFSACPEVSLGTSIYPLDENEDKAIITINKLSSNNVAKAISMSHQNVVPSSSTDNDRINENSSEENDKKNDTGMIAETKQKGAVSLKTHAFYISRAFMSPVKNSSDIQNVSSTRGAVLLPVLAFAFLAVPCSRWAADYILGLWSEKEVNPEWSDGLWLGLYFALGGGVLVVAALKEALVAWTSVSASRNLHDRALVSVLNASVPNYFDRTPLGRVIARFTRDLDAIDNRLPISYGYALNGYAQTCLLIITCIIASPWFAIIIPLVAYIFLRIQNKFKLVSVELRRLDAMSRSPLVSAVEETLQLNGVAIVRAFSMEDALIQRYFQVVDLVSHANQTVWSVARWFAIRLDLIASILTLTTALLLVIVKNVSPSAIDPKIAGMALSYIIQMAGVFQWATRSWIDAENNLTACERLAELENLPAEAPAEKGLDPLDTDHGDSECFDGDKIAQEQQFVGIQKDVVLQFDRYCLRYRDELPLALKAVSFSVRKGERLAVVGRSGAGKSTLAQAILRVVEGAHGRILFAGQDVRSIGLRELRNGSLLSVVPQEPMLLSGSIRQNLDPEFKISLPVLPQLEPPVDSLLLLRNFVAHRLQSANPKYVDGHIGNDERIKSTLQRAGVWRKIVETSNQLFSAAVAALEYTAKPITVYTGSKTPPKLHCTKQEANRLLLRLRNIALNDGDLFANHQDDKIEAGLVAAPAPSNSKSAGIQTANNSNVARPRLTASFSVTLTDSEVLDMPIVSAGGLNLSLGERQLLCIARALLRDAQMIILDEATANVDAGTSRIVQSAVQNTLMSGDSQMSVLTIAHRLDTAVESDRIMVMAAGRVVEIGSPGELLAMDGGLLRGLVEGAGKDELDRVFEVLKRRGVHVDEAALLAKVGSSPNVAH